MIQNRQKSDFGFWIFEFDDERRLEKNPEQFGRPDT